MEPQPNTSLSFPVVRRRRDESPDFGRGGRYTLEGNVVVSSPPLSPIIIPGTPTTPSPNIAIANANANAINANGFVVSETPPPQTPQQRNINEQFVVPETPQTPGTIPRQLLFHELPPVVVPGTPPTPPASQGGIGRHKYTFISKRRKSKRSKSRSKSKRKSKYTRKSNKNRMHRNKNQRHNQIIKI